MEPEYCKPVSNEDLAKLFDKPALDPETLGKLEEEPPRPIGVTAYPQKYANEVLAGIMENERYNCMDFGYGSGPEITAFYEDRFRWAEPFILLEHYYRLILEKSWQNKLYGYSDDDGWWSGISERVDLVARRAHGVPQKCLGAAMGLDWFYADPKTGAVPTGPLPGKWWDEIKETATVSSMMKRMTRYVEAEFFKDKPPHHVRIFKRTATPEDHAQLKAEKEAEYKKYWDEHVAKTLAGSGCRCWHCTPKLKVPRQAKAE